MAFEGLRRRIDAVKGNRVVAFVLTVQKRFGEDGAGNLAASLTYFAFLSLFPLLLVAASILGFVLANDPAGQARVARELAGSIPGLGRLIGENVDALVDARSTAGIVGVLGALWSGTALARAASFALSRVSRKPEKSNFLQTQLWAIGSTIGLGALALIATGAGAALPTLAFTSAAGAALGLLGVVASFALDLVLFTVCYRVLNRSLRRPSTQSWRGALIPAIGWTALKFGGAWYARHSVKGSTAVFGTFASVVGILVILYLVARLFMYGAELNAVLSERRGSNSPADAPQPVAA
ncbi:MAG: YihY/virulence factor BrkB family protein [Actinomycetota bacterium]